MRSSGGVVVAGLLAAAITCLAAGCGGGSEADGGLTLPDTGHGGGVVITGRDGGPADGHYVPHDGGIDTGAEPEIPDGGEQDAGAADAEIPDAGSPDAETPDAEVPDAGGSDAGEDGGVPDAGPLDAGAGDAGVADATVEDTGVFDAGPGSGKVVINEIMKVPVNGDPVYGQYVEIFNDTDAWVDIEGWTLKANQSSFTFAGAGGQTGVSAHDFLVAGASDDDAKNSYAHVAYVWPPTFTLPTGTCALRLQDKGGVTIDAVQWDNTFPWFNGSSIERKSPALDGNLASSWQRSPSLIAFLPDTGEYGADRGSPRAPSFEVLAGTKVTPGPGGVVARIDDQRQIWRFPVDVKAKDIMAFKADTDGVSGNLESFLSLVDATGEIIWKDLTYLDDGLDFWIYYTPAASGTLAMQVQADLSASFEAATFAAKAYLADWLDLAIPGNRRPLLVGGTLQIDSIMANFSADHDAIPRALTASQVAFSTSSASIATVDATGTVTGVAKGTAVITVTYHGGTRDLVTTLTVDVSDLPTNETCGTAFDISNLNAIGSTTAFAFDDYSPAGCVAASSTGPDLVFSFSAATALTWTFTVTPLGQFNPILYVYDACPFSGNCLGGTKLNGPGQPETLEFAAQANKTYYLVVDGDLASGDDRGGFTIQISKK